MKSSDGDLKSENVSEGHSTVLLTNLRHNLFSLITKNDSSKPKNGIHLSLVGQDECTNNSVSCINYSEIRCQSLPDCVEKNVLICDSKQQEGDDTYCTEIQHSPSTSESWFRTWPERCDKQKSTETTPNNSTVTTPIKNQNTLSKFNCDYVEKNIKNKVSLNEALKNISLAYSPVTKQLHVIEKSDITFKSLQNSECSDLSMVENCSESPIPSDVPSKKIGHRRTEAGSFSSTISTISEPSSNGSLLSTDDRSLSSFEIPNGKTRKKSLTNFFSKHVFPWKGSTIDANTSGGVWKIFSKQNPETPLSSPIHVVASSSALIQLERPSNLPAKTLEEEQRHRNEYRAILAAAKKKDAQTTAAIQKQQKLQLKLEEQLAASTKHFLQYVLPNWDVMRTNKKTLDLWWQGLPSSVRGKVWRLAIGNELNLTPQLYEICLCRAQSRLNSPEPPKCDSDVDQESSLDVIQLDISRTFPHLCIFQEGGPYSETLHSLLAAYVCYRPDVGYVQGMSYIAAILILNMEQYDAFICFANLLNQPLHLAAFTLNQAHMQAYYNAYNQIFSYNLPKLYLHFERSGLTPDLYLLDWIYTIFAKAMPLDIACRVWDIFLRDGYEFIFRTALGILHLNQDILMAMDFINGAQFLTRLPDDMPSDQLFKSIQLISTTIGKQTFTQIVEKCLFSIPETYRDLA